MRDDWQLIETAPKDGTRALLGHIGVVRGVARCIKSYWQYEAAGFWIDEPTHWMPLPEPPAHVPRKLILEREAQDCGIDRRTEHERIRDARERTSSNREWDQYPRSQD